MGGRELFLGAVLGALVAVFGPHYLPAALPTAHSLLLRNYFAPSATPLFEGQDARFGVHEPLLEDSEVKQVLNALREYGTSRSFQMYAVEVSETTKEWGLPDRYDVAKNFLSTGGRWGDREPFSSMVARTSYFRDTLATIDKSGRENIRAPGIEALLHKKALKHAAGELYFPGSPKDVIVKPNLVYANVMIPGMELGVHVDVPAFRGLDRTKVPQWLLVCMHLSGLFDKFRIRTATAVSWWAADATGGKFVFYPHGPNGDVIEHTTSFNSAIVVDTDSVVHGVDRVSPDAAKKVQARGMARVVPGMRLTRNATGGADDWYVLALDGKTHAADYQFSDIRISLSWKAFVFESDAEYKMWLDGTDDISAEEAINALVADLKERGVLGARATAEPSRELAMAMIREYIKFPAPTRKSLIPFNYCLIPPFNILCGGAPDDLPPLADPLDFVMQRVEAAKAAVAGRS